MDPEPSLSLNEKNIPDSQGEPRGSLPNMEDGEAGVKAGCRGGGALEEAGSRGGEVSTYDVEAAGGRMNDGTAEATGLEAEAEVCHHCIWPQVSARWSMKCLQDTTHF